MASLRDLSKQIETAKFEDSKVGEMQGANVRTPSLIPGQIYMAKGWKLTVEGSDNPYMVVRFVGSGKVDSQGVKVLNEENPRIKDMGKDDRYFFEKMVENRIGEFNCYQNNDCLVFGDTPVRLTFFEIQDITVQVKPAKKAAEPKESKPGRTKKDDTKAKKDRPKVSRVRQKKNSEDDGAKHENAENGEEGKAAEDNNDNANLVTEGGGSPHDESGSSGHVENGLDSGEAVNEAGHEAEPTEGEEVTIDEAGEEIKTGE